MLPRRRGRTEEESKIGEKYARQIEFAMAGCDAKTGPTKTEFGDISQNKLAQPSVDVFPPLWRAFDWLFCGAISW